MELEFKKIEDTDTNRQYSMVGIFYAKMRYGYVYCFSNAEIDISYYKTCDEGLFWVEIFKWRQEK